jgi:hypothetical protein
VPRIIFGISGKIQTTYTYLIGPKGMRYFENNKQTFILVSEIIGRHSGRMISRSSLFISNYTKYCLNLS